MKVDNNSNLIYPKEKFYSIKNIKENEIIFDISDHYDSNKMIFVKGGKFIFGNNEGLEREKPEQEVIIQSFLIDKNLVSVEDFRNFINESNYITEAEKFGDAIIFDDTQNKWKLVDGAYWEYPLGVHNEIASNNHPVTQVSWNDALAYCEFYDKTLPSEVQWEYAASERGRKKNQLFYWGNELLVNNVNPLSFVCVTFTIFKFTS